MIQLGTVLKVTDKTSVVLAHCIKVLGSSRKKIANVGDVVLVSVRWHNVNRLKFLKPR